MKKIVLDLAAKIELEFSDEATAAQMNKAVMFLDIAVDLKDIPWDEARLVSTEISDIELTHKLT